MNPQKRNDPFPLKFLFIFFAALVHLSYLPRFTHALSEQHTREAESAQVSPELWIKAGKEIIFNTQDPEAMLRRGRAAIGKGQCPLCHKFFEAQKAERCPNMMALPSSKESRFRKNIGERANKHINNPRYEASKKRNARGEKDSGFIPHAKTGGQYLIESLYCPNCFVVKDYGLKGTNNTKSPMPMINRTPLELEDAEIVAVVAYLQAFSSSGDMSKVTALADWEAYFEKKLTLGSLQFFSAPTETEQLKTQLSQIATIEDSPQSMLEKMNCVGCHKIPGLPDADTGTLGPVLSLGTTVLERLKSASYQEALNSGRSHATTPRDYVIESIVDPSAYIVPGYVDGMLPDYGHKFTVSALDKLVEFLLISRKENEETN